MVETSSATPNWAPKHSAALEAGVPIVVVSKAMIGSHNVSNGQNDGNSTDEGRRPQSNCDSQEAGVKVPNARPSGNDGVENALKATTHLVGGGRQQDG